MKKIFSLIMIFVLTISLFTYSFASTEPDNNVKLLFDLGILKGSGGGLSTLEAEKPITKLTAGVLTLRLIGLENEAAVYGGNNNFADIKEAYWAKSFMAYFYDNPSLGWNDAQNMFGPNKTVSNK